MVREGTTYIYICTGKLIITHGDDELRLVKRRRTAADAVSYAGRPLFRMSSSFSPLHRITRFFSLAWPDYFMVGTPHDTPEALTDQRSMLIYKIDTKFLSWVPNFAPLSIGPKKTTAIVELERSFCRMKPEIALSVAESVFLSDFRKVLPKVMVPTSRIQSKKDIDL